MNGMHRVQDRKTTKRTHSRFVPSVCIRGSPAGFAKRSHRLRRPVQGSEFARMQMPSPVTLSRPTWRGSRARSTMGKLPNEPNRPFPRPSIYMYECRNQRGGILRNKPTTKDRRFQDFRSQIVRKAGGCRTPVQHFYQTKPFRGVLNE